MLTWLVMGLVTAFLVRFILYRKKLRLDVWLVLILSGAILPGCFALFIVSKLVGKVRL